MKKRTLSRLIVLSLLVLTLFACRKSIEFYVQGKEAPQSALIESAKIWRDQHIIKAPSGSIRRLRPYWEDAWLLLLSDGRKLILVPTPEKRIRNKNFSIRRFYMFSVSGDHISDGKIVEFLGEQWDVNQSLDVLLENVGNEKILDFDGLISEYDINYRLIKSATYENGLKSNRGRRLVFAAKSSISNYSL